MKSCLDCIACFFKQALYSARISGVDEKEQKKVLDKIALLVPKISLENTPVEIARKVNKLLTEVTKNEDIYSQIKKNSNCLALKVYPLLKKKVSLSKDRLLKAVELAIAGNIIDYGAKSSLNIDEELERILKEENSLINKEDKSLFNYKDFKRTLKDSKTILYLADNAGETVFDRVLIEEIKAMDKNKSIIYAVKEKPVINDALIEDALASGINETAEVISSGSDAPGTVLSLCSKKFLKIYKNADMVISKGQGNFEALSSEKRDIFFLFMAKCQVIANNAGCNLGDIILKFKK